VRMVKRVMESAVMQPSKFVAMKRLCTLVLCSLLMLGSTTFAATQPLPPSSTWAEVNNVLLRYQLLGEGSNTVVLLHELSMSLEVWDELLPSIARGHRILRYDLRGAGLSERVSGPITMDDEVEDLRALLTTLNIHGKVILVGSTAGGAIALKFAADHPEMVSGVVALSPAAYMTPQPQRLGNNGNRPPRSAREMRVENHEEIFPAKIREAHPDRLMRYRGIYYASDPTASTETTRMLYSIGFAEVLPKIQCPVVVVATSLFIRPVAELKEIAAAIPQGRLEVLETGHLAALESPELVAPLLLKFFKQVERQQ